jgi:hypothetical protein
MEALGLYLGIQEMNWFALEKRLSSGDVRIQWMGIGFEDRDPFGIFIVMSNDSQKLSIGSTDMALLGAG